MRSNEIFTLLCFALLVFSPTAAQSQEVSIGVVGGAALTDDFRSETSAPTVLGQTSGSNSFTVYTTTHSNSKDYVVGGIVQVGLPANFSIEVDGLYRPMNFASFTTSVPSGVSSPSNTVVTWEFPVLLKYRLQTLHASPFLEVGPSFRVAGNLNDTSPSNHGVTAGTGAGTSWRRIGILAEGRYTRWADDTVAHVYQPRTNPNQVELLTGWSLHGRRKSNSVE